jgi:trans-aconitate methyltransferase
MNFNSKQYWESRYSGGGNSGVGSYGLLAEYKSSFITNFIIENNIKHLVEFGCGDGNNLKMISDNNKGVKIIGVDVSQTALNLCVNKMPEHKFIHKDEFDYQKTDLVLSMDVIYHLIEDDVYEDYMDSITKIGSKYLIIYSPDFDKNDYAKHVKARKYTDNKLLQQRYRLIYEHKNKYSIDKDKNGSFSDWKIFKNILDE